FTHIANSDDRSRHFDLHSYVMECIVAAEFLNDFTHHDLAVDYVRKGLEVIGGKGDRWSLNHRMRLLNLGGEALLDGGDAASALAMFDEAVGIGTELMERSSVDGYDEIMFSLVNRADCRIALDDFDGYLRDAEVAVKFAEELRDTGIMDMKDEIVRIHQEMAEVLMKRGDFKGAEKHLMSAMGISIDGAREYIELHSQE
ncbi:MAG: hypothetical protein IJ856_02615, partial [Candidatus Methanomethylophilaceae archaeon]|nr:hypothetical protein [Candidatus Methanomethylophilaceae archaeon]